jgi:NAD(P)-dependent dehydrogenase (short-subunit alcohol dehydrogenase family)
VNIDLSDCRALVTGGSRGIGRAIAEALIASGARVAVQYRSERAAAEEVVRGHAGSCVLGADLNSPSECEGLFQRAEDALGGIDLLVNNAGIAMSSPLESADEVWVAEWERTLAVNLTASAVLSRAAIRAARSRRLPGVRLIFMSSRAAFRGDAADYVAYAASKGGMVALARSIARSFGKEGVKSFVIAPGFTRTEMAEEFIHKYGEDYAMKTLRSTA